MKTSNITNNFVYTKNKTDISSLRGCFNTLSASVNLKLKSQAIESLHKFFSLGNLTPANVKSAVISGTDLQKNSVTLKIKDMYFFENVQGQYINVDKNTSKPGNYSFLPFDLKTNVKDIAQNIKSSLMEFRSIGDIVIEQQKSSKVDNVEFDKVDTNLDKSNFDKLNLSGITNLSDNPYVLDLSYRDGKEKLLDEYIIENNLLSEKVSDLEQQNHKLLERNEHVVLELKNQQTEVYNVKAQLQEQISKYKSVSVELDSIKKQLEQKSNNAATLTNQNKQLANENSGLKNQYETLQSRYNSLQNQYNTDTSNLRSQFESSKNEAVSYKNQYSSYYNQVSSLNSQISNLQNKKFDVDIYADKSAQAEWSPVIGMRITNTSYVQLKADNVNWHLK